MANSRPKVSNIAINAKGGALTPITLTIMASRVQVMEDPALNNGVPQGLTGFYTDTQPATGFPNIGSQQVWLAAPQGQQGPAYQPINFGDPSRVKGGDGEYVGAQGTVILNLTTNSNTPGGVLLLEYD